MSKQDGYAARTVADLERKYNFGQSFADVYGLATGAQNAADNAQQAADEARKAADQANAAFAGLNQEQIFNLLTNFGAAQGVYRDETGNVYVNATYIRSGKLAAEYIDATNLKVAAANITGELVATQINTKDLKVLAANIIGTLTAGQIDATNLQVSAANITGTLKASQIDATTLKVKAANIDGTIAASQIDATSLTVKAANISGTLTASQINTSSLTISGANVTGTLSSAKISATRVTAGTLDASTIELSAGYGGFGVATGHYTDPDGSSGTTYGAKVFGTSPSSTYLIVTGSGVRMQSSGANFFVSGSVIKASTTIEEGSDRRMKQDISYGVEKYRTFLRKLKPTLYRYKADPTSPMLCGFIAQDVEAALTECGLTRQDFDGIRGGELNDETGEPSTYGLAYSQFVALLTDAVQDIYARLETVENNLGG